MTLCPLCYGHVPESLFDRSGNFVDQKPLRTKMLASMETRPTQPRLAASRGAVATDLRRVATVLDVKAVVALNE